MKAGDEVTIYEDPITQRQPEGNATLVELVSRLADGEIWEVRFKGEDDTYQRLICPTE